MYLSQNLRCFSFMFMLWCEGLPAYLILEAFHEKFSCASQIKLVYLTVETDRKSLEFISSDESR